MRLLAKRLPKRQGEGLQEMLLVEEVPKPAYACIEAVYYVRQNLSCTLSDQIDNYSNIPVR